METVQSAEQEVSKLPSIVALVKFADKKKRVFNLEAASAPSILRYEGKLLVMKTKLKNGQFVYHETEPHQITTLEHLYSKDG
jgi:hypothetical protein